MSNKKKQYCEKEELNSSILYLKLVANYINIIGDKSKELKDNKLTRDEEERIFNDLSFSFKNCNGCLITSFEYLKRVRKEKRRASFISRIKKTIQIWKR